MARMMDVTDPCPIHRATCTARVWSVLRAVCGLNLATMRFVRHRIDRRLATMQQEENQRSPETPPPII